MTTPHEGLTHLPTYDVKDSNVELIGTDVDHKVKYASAATEPAWKEIPLSQPQTGLRIWRIEQFEVISVPPAAHGMFYEGDSYIVLHTYKRDPKRDVFAYDIFFWLGSKTTQDEAGTAAYKTVELDEYLGLSATQLREVQGHETSAFTALFPRLTILSGGVKSGFRHVETVETSIFRLLQITASGGGMRSGVIIHEVEPTWESLNEGDVFVLDEGKKLTSWQGKRSSPLEKAKAAQAISAIASETERRGQAQVEVFAQEDARSVLFVKALGGDVDSKIAPPTADSAVRRRRMGSGAFREAPGRPVCLFMLSDASGTLKFEPIKHNEPVTLGDFRSEDIFVYDSGLQVFVWQGSNASANEQRNWLRIAQAYLRTVKTAEVLPLGKVQEGHESPAFLSSLGVA